LSKNEYLANCLSRVQVSEDRFERKMRELREDDEEKEHQVRVAKLRNERTSRAGDKNEEEKDDQPPGRSILDLMKMKRKPAMKAGPAGKRRKVMTEHTDINIKLFLEVAEEMCMRAGELKAMLKKDLQRMERRWACLDVEKIVMDIPSWWIMMGDKGLQQAVHEDDEKLPTTIRKMAEGRKKKKKRDEKAEINKRMENCWSMVGLVGWWRRVESEKKQEKGVRKSSDRQSQSSAKLSFVKKFFPDKVDKIELEVDENEPKTKLLSTPRKSIPDVAILSTTGSKRKRDYLSGGILKKQKVSPSIARKILFFEEKSKINTQDLELGTAQNNLVRSSDLAGLASKFTAGRQQM
jgi:hypothetical protein